MYPMPILPELLFEDEELLLRRPSNAFGEGLVIVGGKRVLRPGTFTDYTIRCNVQPPGGDDLILEPAGDRFDEQYLIWVPVPFEQPLPNDLVLREDEWFLVMQARGWGSYTRSLIQRIDVGPDRAMGV